MKEEKQTRNEKEIQNTPEIIELKNKKDKKKKTNRKKAQTTKENSKKPSKPKKVKNQKKKQALSPLKKPLKPNILQYIDLRKNAEKPHKKNKDFFTIREDYFLLIAEDIYQFPSFGYKSLTLFIKDISFNTGKTFKSIQRRREKLKKLSNLQIAVIKNYYVNYIKLMNSRKIHNLKNELITILKTDNTDIEKEEKIFINWIVENFEKNNLESYNKNKRKRGRPRKSKSIQMQENLKKINVRDIYSFGVIEDLKKFLNQKKNYLKQIKFDFFGKKREIEKEESGIFDFESIGEEFCERNYLEENNLENFLERNNFKNNNKNDYEIIDEKNFGNDKENEFEIIDEILDENNFKNDKQNNFDIIDENNFEIVDENILKNDKKKNFEIIDEKSIVNVSEKNINNNYIINNTKKNSEIKKKKNIYKIVQKTSIK